MQTNHEPTLANAFRANIPVPMTNQVNDKQSPQTQDFHKKQTQNEPLIYQPHWIQGGAKHPGLIVETPRLANVAPPQLVTNQRYRIVSRHFNSSA